MIHTGRHFLQIPAVAATELLPLRVSAPSASVAQRVTLVGGERSEKTGMSKELQ